MLKNNKSPGPDGMISEFYKMFWSTIRPIYLEVIQNIYTSEEMAFTQYQAIISLLYKKRAGEDIKNWRPISLLNNDYKIWINSVLCDALLHLVPSHRMSQY